MESLDEQPHFKQSLLTGEKCQRIYNLGNYEPHKKEVSPLKHNEVGSNSASAR